MNPIAELKTEHETVRVVLNVLRQIADETTLCNRITHKDDIVSLIDFFRTFLDRCHHAKEEKLLFPALEALGVGRNGGPIGVMLSEHEQGRSIVSAMERALHVDSDESRFNAQRFAEAARSFVELLDRHIEKENTVLFPLAEMRLSPEEMATLEEGFGRIEAEKIGPGRHEAYHGLIGQLVKKHLDTEPIHRGNLQKVACS